MIGTLIRPETKETQTGLVSPATIITPDALAQAKATIAQAIESLEDAAILSEELDDSGLLASLSEAQELLDQAREIERILRDEAAKRIREAGGTKLLTETHEATLKENKKRLFSDNILFQLKNHLPADVYSATHEVKVSWKWAELKKAAKVGGNIAAIVEEGTEEKLQAPNLKVKVRK